MLERLSERDMRRMLELVVMTGLYSLMNLFMSIREAAGAVLVPTVVQKLSGSMDRQRLLRRLRLFLP